MICNAYTDAENPTQYRGTRHCYSPFLYVKKNFPIDEIQINWVIVASVAALAIGQAADKSEADDIKGDRRD
jgi:hypothetical protein